jgi:hypothetical protein
MTVCIGMLCIDDMCAFHAPYIEKERSKEWERERLGTVDEKKNVPLWWQVVKKKIPLT